MSGVIYLGLEYSSIPVVMDVLHVPVRRRPLLLAELQTMERAAIVVFNEKRDS